MRKSPRKSKPKRKKAPKKSAGRLSKPSIEEMPDFPDQVVILAQMATEIFCRVDYKNGFSSSPSVAKSVSSAWSILKASEQRIKEERETWIRKRRGDADTKKIKDAYRKIRSITGENRKCRAVKKFKDFLAGKSRAGGKNEVRDHVDIKSFDQYAQVGIENNEVGLLALLFKRAFPKSKRSFRAMDSSATPKWHWAPTKRTILISEDEIDGLGSEKNE
jgi:hypothetical protein